MKTRSLRELLSGGDRRSKAESDHALLMVRENPALVPELVGLTGDPDWLVSMRSADLLEKVAHEQPGWIDPHKTVFIGKLAESDKWEVRLQIVRALPLFEWSEADRRRAVDILLRDVEYPQTFVKAWALNSLATFSERDAALVPIVRRHLRRFERSGSKALEARARKIRERLSR